MDTPLCPECNRRPAQRHRRGLCWTCSQVKAIRDRYPRSPRAPRQLTPAQRRRRDRAILRRRDAGEPLRAIAADLGVSYQAVQAAELRARKNLENLSNRH